MTKATIFDGLTLLQKLDFFCYPNTQTSLENVFKWSFPWQAARDSQRTSL